MNTNHEYAKTIKESIGDNLKSIVQSSEALGFSGVVLVAHGSDYLLHEGFGEIAGHAVQSNDRFWIASVGKQFTSTAIMALVEQNILRLDDPLSLFFEIIPDDKADITIRQLLTHTSGLGQSYVSEKRNSRNAAVKSMFDETLKFETGDKFHYSNSNFQLAAAIIEIVTGYNYANYLEKELWGPAKLIDTGFAGVKTSTTVSPILTDELPSRLRSSYWGEQGVYSSASDLFRWYQALQSGLIIDKKYISTLFTSKVAISVGYSGMGWYSSTSPNNQPLVFTRGNEDFGANSLLYAYPDQEYVIVILTHAGDANENISWSRKIHKELEIELGL